jgi:hypothetical protein
VVDPQPEEGGEAVPMRGAQRRVRIAIAVVSIIAAVIGLLYNAYAFWHIASGDWSNLFNTQLRSFLTIFCIMIAVCTAFYVLLLGAGIAFLRGRLNWVGPFVIGLICEAAYWLLVYAPWRILTPGWSAAAVRNLMHGGYSVEGSAAFGMATTIANAGMVAQFDLLFPLWGPALMWWVKRSVDRSIG